MARFRFGGGLADWTFNRLDGVDGHNDIAQLAGGVTVTFWNAHTGGSQYTDLLDDQGGAITEVVSSDGSDGHEVGTIARFQGPDAVTAMWADAGGPRQLILADVGGTAQQASSEAAAAAAGLATHEGSTNPHGVRMVDLADVDASPIADGEVLAWNTASGLFLPTDVEGVTGVVSLTTAQTITGHKTFRPPAGTQAATLEAVSGQTADLLRALSEAGLVVLRVDAGGNLRLEAATGQTAAIIKARSGQTAHLTRWVDSADNAIAWVEPDGRVRAPNTGYTFPYSIPGTLAVIAGAHRIYNDTGRNLTIRAVRASVGTAPTGADIIVDINISGATIFATQANRPTIAAGANTSGKVTNMDITTLNDGQYLTVDVDQIGSTVEGADLTVQVLAY